MKRFALPIALALLTTACATPDRAGVRDQEVFRQVANQTILDSARPAADVARCFEDRAALLPMSSFVQGAASDGTTYRLRGFGFTFEEIDFQTAPSGSRMTIFLAPNVNAKWLADFERDRAAPPRACAATLN